MAYYDSFEKYGDKAAMIDDEAEIVTYRQLAEFCENMSEKTESRRLVFIFCENAIGSICGYLACLRRRIVPVLLDRHIDETLRKNLMEIYMPDYLYFPDDMAHEMTECDKNIKCIFRDRGYGMWECDTSHERKMYDELALLLTTSGSTGSPKLVRQSYENIQSNAEAIVKYLRIDEGERPITTLPMNYTYGLSIINSHILCGATILVTKRTLMERDFWTFFKEEGATSFGGVPYTYEMLKKLRFFRMELPSLKVMTQAGGKLSPELHREYAQYAMENGKNFVVMYGQCEATARMAYLPPDKSLEKYGSMGIAIPGGRLELTDSEGNIIEEADTVGELIYYGRNVTLGYAENAKDLEKGNERGYRLETGDMAKRDADGYYYIVGRKKRFLKIFGNRVNLDETERMVKSYMKDGECACGGVDDKLYVFITDPSDTLREEIKSRLAETTGLHPLAFEVKYIDNIPKNEAGKILYVKLEDFYDGV